MFDVVISCIYLDLPVNLLGSSTMQILVPNHANQSNISSSAQEISFYVQLKDDNLIFNISF